MATIFLGLAGIYVAYCGILFANQRSMMFPRDKIPKPTEISLETFDAEVVQIKTSFGQVESWFFPPKVSGFPKPYPTVIIAHGNAELIDDYTQTYLENFMRFLDFGMAVYLVEYPGYGRSQGEPTKKTVTETFVAAYDTLVLRPDVDKERILFFGRSLGGAAVCALASKRPSKAMILFTTFTSVGDMATTYMVPKIFIRDPFDNLAVVKSYPGPILVIHGTEDRVIPYSQGLRLFHGAQNGTMITYACGHNNWQPDWENHWDRVTDFLNAAEVLK